MTWRDIARPIIAEVIAEYGVNDKQRLRKALRAAYPFGPRQYHPYRIWLHEIRLQLGELPLIGTRKPPAAQPGQRELF